MEEVVGLAVSDPNYPRDSELIFLNGTLISATGHGIALFKDLCFLLNLTAVLKKGTGWGDKAENGSWTGISTQLLVNEGDICISQATLNAERAEVFTFLQPTYRGSYVAHFRPPPTRSLRNVFAQPFHPNVWLLLLLTIILATMALKAIYVIQYRCKVRTFPHVEEISEGYGYEQDGNVSDLFIWMASNFCQRGWFLTPRGPAMKIVFFTVIVATTISYVAYTANLYAIFKIGDSLITDFKVLQKRLEIIGDKSIPFIGQILQDVHRNKKRKGSSSTKRLPAHQQTMGINDAVEQILSTRSAFVTVEGFYKAFLERNHTEYEYCNQISTIKALKTTRWAGMYVRRNWTKKEMFGRSIIKLIERGLNFRYSLAADEFTTPNCDFQRNLAKSEEIPLEDVVTAFVQLLIGSVISILLLVFEILLQMRRKCCLNARRDNSTTNS